MGGTQVGLTSIQLLSESECREIRSSLHDLKSHWIQRHPRVPYFTLGASNYWDLVKKSQEHYVQESLRKNQILWKHFEPLYEKLKSTLAFYLDTPTTYDRNLALPGFHIILGDDRLKRCEDVTHHEWFKGRTDPDRFLNAIHCDTPHLIVDFGEGSINNACPLSFTGAISLPQKGAGLYTWALTLDESILIPDNQLLMNLNATKKDYHRYTQGEIFLHSGLIYHQMAKLGNIVPGEERITLQGHAALREEKEWVLYW